MTRSEAATWVKFLSLPNIDNQIQTINAKRNNIEILRAYSEGKDIEFAVNTEGTSWIPLDSPEFDSKYFEYRIKPKTKIIWYRNYVTPLGFIGLQCGKSSEDVEYAERVGKNYSWINEASYVEVKDA